MKKSLKRLVIDTATKYIYIALIENNLEIDYVYQVGDNDHSVTIMPILENLLKKQNMELKDLDQIIIGIGPGSYTGVRIGVTVGKMIAFLNDIEVYQISSLALMASHSDQEFILPLIDARRSNAFMAFFKQSEGKIQYIHQDILTNINNFKSQQDKDFEEVISGKPNIEKILRSNLLIKVEDIHDLVPNYLQVTEAERNLQK